VGLAVTAGDGIRGLKRGIGTGGAARNGPAGEPVRITVSASVTDGTIVLRDGDGAVVFSDSADGDNAPVPGTGALTHP
jgi:hypothetical protein